MMRRRKPAGPPRLSHEMAYVLRLATQQGADIWWVPLVDGKGSQSRTVGRGLTIEALWRHGWIERGTANPTPEGRAMLVAYDERWARTQERRNKKLARAC